jgi:hypothetical protein
LASKERGAALRSQDIRRRAQSLSRVPGFKASKGWLDKFCRRYRLRLLEQAIEIGGRGS